MKRLFLSAVFFGVLCFASAASAATFPNTPILDSFDRAAESPLSGGGKWITSGGTQGFAMLETNGSGAVAPSSPSGSSWATRFSLPVEEYVDLSATPDSSGVWLQFLDNATSSAINGEEVGFFSGHYEIWGGPGANTLLKYAATTISASDTVGYSVDATGLITVWRKHFGTWGILGTATDAQHISDGWIDVTADTGLSLDNFGGGTPVTAPANTGAPAVSGSTVQGRTLTTTNGTWTDSPTSYSYQWQDCDAFGASCTNVAGATTSSYTLAASDVGHTMRSVVTARNSAGSTSVSSVPTTVVTSPAPPTNTSLPTISGTPQLGQTLSANSGRWVGSPTSYTYQWQDCATTCSNIPGATDQTYTLQASDFNQTIDVIVTATNAGGSSPATSATVGPVAVAPPGSCGPAPGATQTLGRTTYDREGVDNFTKDAPVGSFAESEPSQVVYTGDSGMGWTEYPDGWGTPQTGTTEAYQPSSVQSVHDGVLDYYLHNDSNGNPVSANPSPLPGGNRYQTYGVWSVCEKVVADPGSDLNDFHQAYTIFPLDDTLWASGGESDYPEFGLGGGGTPSFFLHWGGPNGSGNSVDQDIGSVPTPFDPTQWHVYTQEWKTDGTRAYYVDGKLVGTSTSSPFSQPERWQLQVEPSGTSNDGGHGHVYVDWAWIGSSVPAPPKSATSSSF